MTTIDLEAYVIRSAERYLEYLEREDEDKGLHELPKKRMNVEHSKLEGCYRLVVKLARPPKYDFYNAQNLVVRVGRGVGKKIEWCDDLHIALADLSTTYNPMTLTLSIDLHCGSVDSVIEQLENRWKIRITANNVDRYLYIFMDTKLFVRSILDFLNNRRGRLRLEFPNQAPLDLKIDPKGADPHQLEAIRGVFAGSFSYVWGLSGSGKTQVVLFNCLLNIQSQGKKALVLTPTHSSLEQALSALIEEYDRRGMDRNRLLRIGVPSEEFLDKYPEVCLQKITRDDEGDPLLIEEDLRSRLASCDVVGLTLDALANKYGTLSSMKDIAHIFVDECSFVPLIKLLVPLQLNKPITILGDHKQLPPVCKMRYNKISEYNANHEVCLWYLGAVFIEKFFSNPAELHTHHFLEEPIFERMRYYKLNISYRYGPDLANFLSEFVYRDFKLEGKGENLEIYYVDSGKGGARLNATAPRGDAMELTSEAEVRSICKLAEELRDYAVITPFNNQRRLLYSALNKDNKDESKRVPVLTVHKSQGREFDTVVFSPVKLHFYLTDSVEKALPALSVAFSRARKKFIIVCDYDYWMGMENKEGKQFICELLKLAKPYKAMSSKIQS